GALPIWELDLGRLRPARGEPRAPHRAHGPADAWRGPARLLAPHTVVEPPEVALARGVHPGRALPHQDRDGDLHGRGEPQHQLVERLRDAGEREDLALERLRLLGGVAGVHDDRAHDTASEIDRFEALPKQLLAARTPDRLRQAAHLEDGLVSVLEEDRNGLPARL